MTRKKNRSRSHSRSPYAYDDSDDDDDYMKYLPWLLGAGGVGALALMLSQSESGSNSPSLSPPHQPFFSPPHSPSPSPSPPPSPVPEHWVIAPHQPVPEHWIIEPLQPPLNLHEPVPELPPLERNYDAYVNRTAPFGWTSQGKELVALIRNNDLTGIQNFANTHPRLNFSMMAYIAQIVRNPLRLDAIRAIISQNHLTRPELNSALILAVEREDEGENLEFLTDLIARGATAHSRPGDEAIYWTKRRGYRNAYNLLLSTDFDYFLNQQDTANDTLRLLTNLHTTYNIRPRSNQPYDAAWNYEYLKNLYPEPIVRAYQRYRQNHQMDVRAPQ